MPIEHKEVFAVHAPSMNWLIGIMNDQKCAHLVRHIVPHDTQSGAYWAIFAADDRMRKHFNGLAQAGGLLE